MIGERIKTLREMQGLSQEALAEAVKMGQNTIARWERGEMQPRGTSVSKLAKALNTTSMFLLGETDDPLLPEENAVIVQGHTENRLIYRDRDMQVNLPESPEGFEMLRRILDLQALKNGAGRPQVLVQA